ncbi:hypothetical protein DJ93_5680 [Bacillus clarus]|uniref:Uncharacterized protein n=1 Tax=Bacillus clarus TaxID=2338372 RepID=A0A090YB07_9BACI|nr:hypothetical protein DJ93_5680 [Bacillus clarus]
MAKGKKEPILIPRIIKLVKFLYASFLEIIRNEFFFLFCC